jgi:hypothetical protein
MITIPYFLRTFPSCPICSSPTGFSPLKLSGVFGCMNEACLNFVLCVSPFYRPQELSESIIDLKLGSVIYRYACEKKHLIIQPSLPEPTIVNFTHSEMKIFALLKEPSLILKKWPMKGAVLPPLHQRPTPPKPQGLIESWIDYRQRVEGEYE